MERDYRDVGGTPGGFGEFVIGAIMTCAGGYLLMDNVIVTTSFWSFFGRGSFGITLLPMLFGVGMLFFNGKNWLGWLLALGGLVFVLAGVIANLTVFFKPTSLFNTLVMLVLLVGGLGLVARALMPHGKKPAAE